MTYKTIVRFRDLQDENHLYLVGDPFPRKGKRVTKKRVTELLTDANRRGKPLIAEVTGDDDDGNLPVSS